MTTETRKQSKAQWAAQNYEQNKDQIAYQRLIKRIQSGTRPTLKTLNRFGLTEADVKRMQERAPKSKELTTVFTTSGVQPLEESDLHLPDPSDGIFTLTDAKRCLQEAVDAGKITAKTMSNYLEKMRRLVSWLSERSEAPSTSKRQVPLAQPLLDLVSAFKDVDRVVKTIDENTKSANARRDYISAIRSTAKHCGELKKGLSPEGVRPLDKYRDIMLEKIKIANQYNDDLTETSTPLWSDVLARVPEVKREYGADSQEHILAQLYTTIPTVRDNFGRIFIGAPLLEAADAAPPEAAGHLDLNKSIIRIHKHKTGRKGALELKIPKKTMASIKRSLASDVTPRKWLITNKFGGPAGTLSGRVKSIMGYSINDMRHSRINHEHSNKLLSIKDRRDLAKQMGHSVDMQSRYIRAGGYATS